MMAAIYTRSAQGPLVRITATAVERPAPEASSRRTETGFPLLRPQNPASVTVFPRITMPHQPSPHHSSKFKPSLSLKLKRLFTHKSAPPPLTISYPFNTWSTAPIRTCPLPIIPSNSPPSRRSHRKPSPTKSNSSSEASFGCCDALSLQRRQEIVGTVGPRVRTRPYSDPVDAAWKEWDVGGEERMCHLCGTVSRDVRRKNDGLFCRSCTFHG
jgi:hypothetical protein